MQKILAGLIFLITAAASGEPLSGEIHRNQTELRHLQGLLAQEKAPEAYQKGLRLLQQQRDAAYTESVASILSRIPKSFLPSSFLHEAFENLEIELRHSVETDRPMAAGWTLKGRLRPGHTFSDLYLFSPSYNARIFNFAKDCRRQQTELTCESPRLEQPFLGAGIFEVRAIVNGRSESMSFVLFPRHVQSVYFVVKMPREHMRLATQEIPYAIEGYYPAMAQDFDAFEVKLLRSGFGEKKWSFKPQEFSPVGTLPVDQVGNWIFQWTAKNSTVYKEFIFRHRLEVFRSLLILPQE